ncbi:MAG TPA: hypothetical protein VK072_06330, partial [Candidatus Avamphibacillus sp.]|nr:hypothetical protein [Candidatus Avamphibacillus sp.]
MKNKKIKEKYSTPQIIIAIMNVLKTKDPNTLLRMEIWGGIVMNNEYKHYIEQILSTWEKEQREGAFKIIKK